MNNCTKPCIRCGESKTIDEFYTHPRMADGHLNKCKGCCKKDAAIVSRTQKARERDFKRHHENPERRRQTRECTYRRRKANPEKVRAYNAIQRAITSGKVKRLPCEVCGDAKSEGHHDDYAKPLEVKWLCRKHHAEIHRRRDENGELHHD